MIEVYTLEQAAAADTPIVFDRKSIQTNNVATMSADNTKVRLNAPGIYQITLSASGTTTAAGEFAVQLYTDGTSVARASAVATTDAGASASVSFETLVEVKRSNIGDVAELSIMYTGAAGEITVADLIVAKVA